MHTITDLPENVLEHIFDALPVKDTCSIAHVCQRWRNIMVARAEKQIVDMGPLLPCETVMIVWEIKRRMEAARHISSKIAVDRRDYFVTFVATRGPGIFEAYLLGMDLEKVAEPSEQSRIILDPSVDGNYMLFHGCPQQITKSVYWDDHEEKKLVDITNSTIVSVYGSMMVDMVGNVHPFGEAGVLDFSNVSDVHAISMHSKHVAIVTKAGVLMTAGCNEYARLGYPTEDDDMQHQFQVVDALQNVCISMTALGRDFSLALDVDGHVYAWGLAGWDGCLGCRTIDVISDNFTVVKKDVDFLDKHEHTVGGSYFGSILPKRIDFDIPVRYIAAGDTFSMLITLDGNLYGFGNNDFGQLGTGDNWLVRHIPTRISGPWLRVCQVVCGRAHSVVLAVEKNGRFCVWTTGDNEKGQLGLSHIVKWKFEFTRVRTLADVNVACVSAGGDSSAATTFPGDLYIWGASFTGHIEVLTEADPLETFFSHYEPFKLAL